MGRAAGGDGGGGMTTDAGCHVGGGIMTRDGGGGGMTAGTSWTSERAIVAAGTCRCMGCEGEAWVRQYLGYQLEPPG